MSDPKALSWRPTVIRCCRWGVALIYCFYLFNLVYSFITPWFVMPEAVHLSVLIFGLLMYTLVAVSTDNQYLKTGMLLAVLSDVITAGRLLFETYEALQVVNMVQLLVFLTGLITICSDPEVKARMPKTSMTYIFFVGASMLISFIWYLVVVRGMSYFYEEDSPLRYMMVLFSLTQYIVALMFWVKLLGRDYPCRENASSFPVAYRALIGCFAAVAVSSIILIVVL